MAKALAPVEDPLIHPSDPSEVALTASTTPILPPTRVVSRETPPGKEAVARAILAAFPDEPRMLEIAIAESRLEGYAQNPRSSAYSYFQILKGTFSAYGCTGTRGELETEIACARKIYDRDGLTPWAASGPW